MKRDLKMFMRGKSVTVLQNMLRQMGYPMNDAPGIFGAATRDGVKDFQKRQGLQASGIVDDALFSLMQKSVGFQADSSPARRKEASPESPLESARLDALIRLLVGKGVISEAEVAEALQPTSPDKKTPGTPLF